MTNPPVTVADELNKKDKVARELENTPQGSSEPSFSRLNGSFASVFNTLEGSDWPPTTQLINAVAELQAQLKALKEKWEKVK